MKWRTKISIILGNILEHYDQALYGLLAPSFAHLFFPFDDPIYSLIAAYGLLPLGLLSKPLGAFVFGKLGDRYGYHRSLMITLLGMAFATCAAGFLPSYEAAGLWSPILLAACRLLQGFFGAGEKTGGAIALLDGIEEKRQGFAGSLFDASGMIGIALASGASAISLTYGVSWRLLFWVGALTGCFAWGLRKVRATQVVTKKPTASLSALWLHRKAVMSIALVSGFSYANYYLLTTFLNGFLPLVSKISLEEALAMNTWLLTLDFLLLPLFGWISERPEQSIRRALLLSCLSSVPLFMFLEGAALWQAALVRIALMLIGISLAASYHRWVFSRAPAEHRFLIVGVGSALGSRLIGAPMPAIALMLYHHFGLSWVPAIPLVISAFGALYSLRERRQIVAVN